MALARTELKKQQMSPGAREELLGYCEAVLVLYDM